MAFTFHPAVEAWFSASFPHPTDVQRKGWPAIQRGDSALLLAPTGSGKTLAAFLASIERLMFQTPPPRASRCRVVYVSPLKALAADIDRNLRAPIAGISAIAAREGIAFHPPSIAIRTGDTPQKERARALRDPPDILITTPESLFLLLTSSARETLRSVETVIVDEIHSLVGSKRGAHLALSLERLEELTVGLQRIGLSATMRPLDAVARFLGGAIARADDAPPRFREVKVIDASAKKTLELSVEVPVEDMSRLGEIDEALIPSGPAAQGPSRRSIWPSIHPRLVELIRSHRSTIIFVNSRRLAERLAQALNDLAEEEIALAHHGSVAREKRQAIEDRLKAGVLPAIVATSSLELGIDMGAIDLVVQIESPPSVASGLQRIGRASHQVGGASRGVLFPKYRGDLLACATATELMLEGKVEATRHPRNPLDVLAQQVVAIAALDSKPVGELFQLVRRATPFAELPRGAFEGVLDMLAGRYPSDEFAELRPRIVWDRILGVVSGRRGAQRTAIANAGTIPDRGLYGVFLAGQDEAKSRRVGELDEEMVYESRVGDVFLLGASSWRIQEITHDRVLVTPAPGEPGKMPFWHGDRPGRSVELGRAIGALARKLTTMPEEAARAKLTEKHGLDRRAAGNLLAYLAEQSEATGAVPSDRTIVLERTLDDLGDLRVCILSPFGARIHAPWAIAAKARLESELGAEVDVIWSDDGLVFRIPESGGDLSRESFFPPAEEIERLVSGNLGGSSLFASLFREAAARALLIPRRFPGRRSPLWMQRRRSQDLLSVAARFPSFPILLEAYRECLQDVFDLSALVDLFQRVASRDIRVIEVDSRKPSPFAASLLFAYVGSFIYEGDAPLAERRAQALSVDQSQLRELLGEAELRELLSLQAVEEVERAVGRLDRDQPITDRDQLHDLLLAVGDLTLEEIVARSGGADRGGLSAHVQKLIEERRVFEAKLGGEVRVVAAEDAARYRDAAGIVSPAGLPSAFLEPVLDPLGDLVSRFARTHGPFSIEALATRFGVAIPSVRAALERLRERDRVIEGELLPQGHGREWCDVEVLRRIKRLSLAMLRKEVEPVEGAALARFMLEWQSILRPGNGLEGVVAAVEQLQGAPIAASVLHREVLPARVRGYLRSDLDELVASGEVIWRGIDALGANDGRIALYFSDQYELLAPDPGRVEGPLAEQIRTVLQASGAVFFAELARRIGGYGPEILDALWSMVWAGEVTNDTLAPLRSLAKKQPRAGRRSERALSSGRSRRSATLALPGSTGRWSLLSTKRETSTRRAAALASALLERHGVLTREAVNAENLPGGFSAIYPILKAMEEAGRIRRGYFVAGLGATQFAVAGADDRLRNARRPEAGDPVSVVLAATDPANPYGAALPWPKRGVARPQRSTGSQVILVDGRLSAYLGRSEKNLLTFLPEDEPERAQVARVTARALASLLGEGRRRALLIERIDGLPPADSVLAHHLKDAGFVSATVGLLKRREAA